mgnify:FL=1
MGVMTLLQLKYIVKIVECGSMNEASHELYVSQPALSSSVKELENELGIEIFTRSSQGIALTVDGAEFLTYARQVLDQASLLEERYKNAKPRKQLCSVSTQHYMFAVEAFVEMIDSTKSDEYEFTIRETRTKDIINQVANMLSEIGIIYLSDFNKDVIGKLLREKHLEFHPLFRAPLHVFISRDNPLAGKKKVTMDDLKPFPFIQYEQGEEGSFFFAEEAVWPEYSPKQINVTDRATILNFIIGLNGYTVCTGIDNGDLNNEKIVTVPLDTDETMLVGWITNERAKLSKRRNVLGEAQVGGRQPRLHAHRLTPEQRNHNEKALYCPKAAQCLSVISEIITADERGSARTPQSGAVLFQVRVGGGLDLRCDVRGAVGVLDALAGFEDLLHVGDGEHREAEFGFDGLHRGRVGILGLLHAVHAQYQADDLDVRLGLELRDDLAHSGAGGHHVVDEQDLHAVRKLRADHHAAVAMVLLLLAVEGVADLHAMGGRQRDGGGHAQRDALVAGPNTVSTSLGRLPASISSTIFSA